LPGVTVIRHRAKTPDELPEDVLADHREALKEIDMITRARKKRKLLYPTNRDVYTAVREVVLEGIDNPNDLPDAVRNKLKKQGFYVGHVTEQRIWRAYRLLVAKGSIPDIIRHALERGMD